MQQCSESPQGWVAFVQFFFFFDRFLEDAPCTRLAATSLRRPAVELVLPSGFDFVQLHFIRPPAAAQTAAAKTDRPR